MTESQDDNLQRQRSERTNPLISPEKRQALDRAREAFCNDPSIRKIGNAFRERAVDAILQAISCVENVPGKTSYGTASTYLDFDGSKHPWEKETLAGLFWDEREQQIFLESYMRGFVGHGDNFDKERAATIIRREFDNDVENVRRMFEHATRYIFPRKIEHKNITSMLAGIASGSVYADPKEIRGYGHYLTCWPQFKNNLDLAYAMAPDDDLSNLRSLLQAIREAADRSGLSKAIDNAYGNGVVR